MQNLWVVQGRCKWGMGKDFSTHINSGTGTIFRKPVYGADTFFIHFYELFFTLDTICADNKDKPMTGCKNQLIKKCLR